MLYAFHGRLLGNGQPQHVSLRYALLTTAALILTILAILILFLFIFEGHAT